MASGKALVTLGDLWAVFVGVTQYNDSQWSPLPFCENDAKRLAELFRDPQRGRYKASNIRLLTDSTAQNSLSPIRNNIIAAVTQLAEVAGPEDGIVFGFFGHGIEHHGATYIVASDSLANHPEHTAIELAWIRRVLTSCRARVKILIFDACHSGSLRGRGMAPSIATSIAQLGDTEGWVVLSACMQDQYSYDFEEKEHGVFTYFLLEALNGDADTDKDGKISVNDAALYTIEQTRRWAFTHGVKQTPELHENVTGEITLLDHSSSSGDLKDMYGPVIAVMGAKGGVGKSTIITAMAELLASAGNNVLIIDGDIETGGITKYLESRVLQRPPIRTVLDIAFEYHFEATRTSQERIGAVWDVTPRYLREERFGKIYLIPARLSSDMRIGFDAMANIQPDAHRNDVAVEILNRMISRTALIRGGRTCILIDSGAEQNPLVSAGFVIAKYGFIVSSPHPEFRRDIPRLEQMHKTRYPNEDLHPSSVVINQATPETVNLWAGAQRALFIREDPAMREASARGGDFDFEGIGYNNFYLDVLKVLHSSFDNNDRRILPDEVSIWIRPFLQAMATFPERVLQWPRFRFLKAITIGTVAMVVAMQILTIIVFLQSKKAIGVLTTQQIIVAPKTENAEAFAEQLRAVQIPSKLQPKISIDNAMLTFRGQLTADDKEEARTAGTYVPYREALVEGSVKHDAQINAALDWQNSLRHLCVLGLFLAFGAVFSRAVRHRQLARRREFLRRIVEIRNTGTVEDLKRIIDALSGDGNRKPDLVWLREQFRRYHPELGI